MAQLEGLDTVQLGLLLRVVCALPTKWSWGLSHPSPPGMVAMVSFPAWTKGRVICWQCGCSSHRQTRWWCHITQVWGLSPSSCREIEFLNPTDEAFCRRGTSTPPEGEGWQNFLLQHFPASAFLRNSTNSPLKYLQVLTEMSINKEGFQNLLITLSSAVCFTPVYINHLKIPIDDTAGQQQKHSHPLPWRSIQPSKQAICFARDHPTPVQVYTFPAKIPWESGKAADHGLIHPCATTFPAATSEITSEESRARL